MICRMTLVTGKIDSLFSTGAEYSAFMLHNWEDRKAKGRRSRVWTGGKGGEKEGRQERKDLVSLPGVKQAPYK